MAADGMGGAIVTGRTLGSLGGPNAGSSDAILKRVDAAGVTAWTVQLGTASNDEFKAVAVDDQGNVFVAGSTRGTLGATSSGDSDAIVACYNLQGTLLWIEQFGTAASDSALAIVADGAGGCLVAGSTDGDLGGTNAGGTDLFVARVDGTGSLGTIAQTGSPEDDRFPAIATDGAGGYFLSAATLGALAAPAAGGLDTFLARYDGSDTELWSVQLGSPGQDFNFELEPDGAGGVFVTGATDGTIGSSSFGGFDRLIGRYDGAGTQLFLDQSGTPDLDSANRSVWDDVQNRLYVVGTRSQNSAVFEDVYLAVYDGNGTLLGQRNFGEFKRDIVVDVALNGSGGVLVAGYGFSDFGGTNQGFTDQFVARFEEVVGTEYCSPAVPNSTGLSSRLRTSGSVTAARENLHLFVDQLPAGSACFFLASQSPGMISMPGGSQGTLCLSGSIGRYVGPGQVQVSGASGTAELLLDLTQTPTPTGFVTVMPGQSWHFQAWHRDANPTPTSNFSSAVVVDFQ